MLSGVCSLRPVPSAQQRTHVKERCIVIPAIKKNAVIPDQLVKKLAGVTLVERAVNTARGVLPGDDIVVLTDSQEIALICERAGVRHHWNKDLRFTSLDIVTEMRGLLTELAREYEHCMILRASCPLLTWVDVEDAWKRFREAQADSLVTVKSMRQRIWNVQGEGLESLLDEDAGHDSEKMLVVESRALIILRLALLDKANGHTLERGKIATLEIVHRSSRDHTASSPSS